MSNENRTLHELNYGGENKVFILTDYDDIVRGVVKAHGDIEENKKAIENCLRDEYNATDGNIQTIVYYPLTDVFDMSIHLWINEEGGPPDLWDFRIQKATLYVE
jgi:hypothetical protein